jgi:hypothetical protein
MSSDEPTDSPAAADESPASSPPRRRRFLPLLLIAGVVASLAPLAPHRPQERHVDFRLEDDRASVTRFDVDWTRLDGDVAGDVVMGSSRGFETGQAPEIVNLTVRLPNGSYALDIRIEHADHTDAIQRRVTLGDADRILIPLRDERKRP